MLQQTHHREALPVVTEDIYPLSPVQEGMVFHDLYAPESGTYVSQYVFTLRGAVDAEVLRRAWEHVLDGCAALRTVFVWEGMAKPVQAVVSRAHLPWEVLDWRDAPAAGRRERMRAYLEAQRVRGFDLLRAPLMRVALVWTGEEEAELVWSHHHLLLDGWSISLVLQDVLTCYDALLRGDAPALPRRRRYRDYIAWLLRQDLGAAEAYWRSSLEGFTTPTPLPTGGPGDVAAGEPPREGGAERLLSASATAALQGFAKQHRVTANTLVQGAWALLLSRYAGEDDVVFGAVVTGRPPELPGMEQMIGLFINTLPVRARVDPDAPVDGWLQRLQQQQRDARSYEYSPLSDVQRWSGVGGGRPLFETLVAFENHPVEEMAGAGERAFVVEGWARMGRSHYPLELMVLPGEQLRLRVEYDAGRIEAPAAERLASHLETVLEGMVAGPRRRLSALSLLRGEERAQVLHAWNATAADYPPACLHELVAAQAERTPGAVAVVFEGEALTYAELEARANRLAHHLAGLGVRPETRVGVCAERSAELVVALLGTLKAGGAYVPLDPSYPAERLAYMLADSGVPVLLTQERLLDRLPEHGARVVCLDRDAACPAGGSAAPPVLRPDPDALAYVIYTSGSTGRPKGAMNAHRGIVNRLLWMQERYGLGAGDVVLQKTPFSFDVSVWEFFWPLLAGARLVLARPEGHRDPAYLSELIEREAVTTLHFVPPMLQAFLEAGEPARCGTLRRVMCSGEALPYALTERFREALPGVELHNLYGPTEAAVDVTHWAAEPRARRVVPIGRPVANTRLYVLDAAGEPAPVGVPGELFLGGVQVGRGYLGRPELTAEKFVPDPFGGEAGARLYRTGDRVRWSAEGEVEYLGRIDFQVKVRGFRIEPGEIEAALLGQDGVGEAVVLVREDAPGDRRLVGYVVPWEGAELSAETLRARLLERLPEYMVPGAFVALERLPLGPNGKTDRRALPAPHWNGAGHVAPRTATEEVLAGIWAGVLGVERVGVEESFFELGGHSLLGMQVVSRVRDAFGAEVPLRALFEAPTVAALAGRIEALRGAAAAPPVERVPRGEPLPLSFAQQRLWLVDRLEPGSAAYNMPGALRLRGALDVAALRASLDALVERHETLRTTFSEAGDGPVQVVHPPAPAALPVLDLRGAPDAEAEAERLAGEEALRPFDLARGPLLRCALLRLAEDDHVLLFTLHHVVSDGWSMGVLTREVGALYAALSRGEEPRLPELPVQYADFAVWQRTRLSGETLEAQVAYWRERLRGAPPLLEVPLDHPRTADGSARAGVHRFALSAEATRSLRALARREGATLFMTLLAGWQALLARWAGQDEVVVGTPIAGRTRRETEGLIGFFVNLLALRADLSGDPAPAELLRRTREAALDAYAHQDLPFEKLVEELDVVRSLAHTPLFQATFALDRLEEGERLRLGGLAVEPFGGEDRVAKFDLELSFQEDEEALEGVLQYRAALFEAETVARMAAHLETLLEALAADPRRPLSRVPLLGGAERAQVLEEWKGAALEVPRACV
ncbi:MAG: amino acid adenylation domain-containing protein, partial [Gemmatimonadota bacterium]